MFLNISNEQKTLPHDQQQLHPRQPTTGFVLIKTRQAGIIASNCCFKPKGLKCMFTEAMVCKVIKTDAAKLFTAQCFRHCQLTLRL